jgi:hypothetical protein
MWSGQKSDSDRDLAQHGLQPVGLLPFSHERCSATAMATTEWLVCRHHGAAGTARPRAPLDERGLPAHPQGYQDDAAGTLREAKISPLSSSVQS